MYTACKVCAWLSGWRVGGCMYVASTVYAGLDECLLAHSMHSICADFG